MITTIDTKPKIRKSGRHWSCTDRSGVMAFGETPHDAYRNFQEQKKVVARMYQYTDSVQSIYNEARFGIKR